MRISFEFIFTWRDCNAETNSMLAINVPNSLGSDAPARNPRRQNAPRPRIGFATSWRFEALDTSVARIYLHPRGIHHRAIPPSFRWMRDDPRNARTISRNENCRSYEPIAKWRSMRHRQSTCTFKWMQTDSRVSLICKRVKPDYVDGEV